MSKPKFYYDSNGKLQLKINWQNAVDKTEDESLVESIDGLSVYDFFLKMATSQIPLPLHALGARMTYLLTFFLRITKPNFGGQWANVNEYWDSYAPYLFRSFAGSYGQTVRPSLYFPDNFTVVYQDGQSETYYSGVDIDLPSKVIDGVYQLNATEMQINLNQPGKGYEGYSDAMNIITDPKATRKLTQAQNGVQGKDSVQFEQHRKMVALEKRNLNQNDGYRFDYWTYLPPAFSGEDTAMGFKIDAEEGYAVLKIQGFNCFVSDALDMWKNMTLAAKEQGVKKLLIDISSNMGGNVVCGNAMTVAMFPSTNYELFQNVMDTPYNVPMQLYVKTIKPLIGTIEIATESLATTDLTTNQIQTMKAAVKSMDILLGLDATDIDPTITTNKEKNTTIDDPRYVLVKHISTLVDALESGQDKENKEQLLDNLLMLIDWMNPWNVQFNQIDWNTGVLLEWATDNFMEQVVTVNRGGVDVRFIFQSFLLPCL